jgi:hypothetical protein
LKLDGGKQNGLETLYGSRAMANAPAFVENVYYYAKRYVAVCELIDRPGSFCYHVIKCDNRGDIHGQDTDTTD